MATEGPIVEFAKQISTEPPRIKGHTHSNHSYPIVMSANDNFGNFC